MNLFVGENTLRAGSTDSPTCLPEPPATNATEYEGWLTVELYPYIDAPDDAAREVREYLDQILATH